MFFPPHLTRGTYRVELFSTHPITHLLGPLSRYPLKGSKLITRLSDFPIHPPQSRKKVSCAFCSQQASGWLLWPPVNKTVTSQRSSQGSLGSPEGVTQRRQKQRRMHLFMNNNEFQQVAGWLHTESVGDTETGWGRREETPQGVRWTKVASHQGSSRCCILLTFSFHKLFLTPVSSHSDNNRSVRTTLCL